MSFRNQQYYQGGNLWTNNNNDQNLITCNDKLLACEAVLPALVSSVNIGSVDWDTSRGRENWITGKQDFAS